MRRKQVQGLAVPAVDIAKRGIADANRILQHCRKHWLKFAGRTTNNLEHVRGCGLSANRLV